MICKRVSGGLLASIRDGRLIQKEKRHPLLEDLPLGETNYHRLHPLDPALLNSL